jgi:hypothetical protein
MHYCTTSEPRFIWQRIILMKIGVIFKYGMCCFDASVQLINSLLIEPEDAAW